MLGVLQRSSKPRRTRSNFCDTEISEIVVLVIISTVGAQNITIVIRVTDKKESEQEKGENNKKGGTYPVLGFLVISEPNRQPLQFTDFLMQSLY